MIHSDAYEILKAKIPLSNNDPFFVVLRKMAIVKTVERNEVLIGFQDKNDKMYFIVSGSFVRNMITSRGETKTVMFHTEGFHEFMKAYDTAYFNACTTYEIVANEKSVIIALDYPTIQQSAFNNLTLLRYYTQKTEALFTTVDYFKNYQLGLTSEEYLLWLYNHYLFLFQRFPAQNIASFMGITPVWLSKLKARLLS